MTLQVQYKPSFVRGYKKLPIELQQEVKEKIALFAKEENHNALKVHQLKGKLKKCHSFSVNYSHRIVFTYENTRTAVLLAIGDHDIYR